MGPGGEPAEEGHAWLVEVGARSISGWCARRTGAEVRERGAVNDEERGDESAKLGEIK